LQPAAGYSRRQTRKEAEIYDRSAARGRERDGDASMPAAARGLLKRQGPGSARKDVRIRGSRRPSGVGGHLSGAAALPFFADDSMETARYGSEAASPDHDKKAARRDTGRLLSDQWKIKS